MPAHQHIQDDPHAQAPAPPAGGLARNYLRAALLVAGEKLSIPDPLPPEPPMSLREILGRAVHLVEYQSGLADAETYEEWADYLGEEQVDTLLDALALVLTPPSAAPN